MLATPYCGRHGILRASALHAVKLHKVAQLHSWHAASGGNNTAANEYDESD
jgi:hypothetical protein